MPCGAGVEGMAATGTADFSARKDRVTAARSGTTAGDGNTCGVGATRLEQRPTEPGPTNGIPHAAERWSQSRYPHGAPSV